MHERRPDIADRDLDVYELLFILAQNGWKPRLIRPRTKHEAYTNGGKKLFYIHPSAEKFNRPYLLTLHEVASGRLLTAVEHGRSVTHYECLLDGRPPPAKKTRNKMFDIRTDAVSLAEIELPPPKKPRVQRAKRRLQILVDDNQSESSSSTSTSQNTEPASPSQQKSSSSSKSTSSSDDSEIAAVIEKEDTRPLPKPCPKYFRIIQKSIQNHLIIMPSSSHRQ